MTVLAVLENCNDPPDSEQEDAIESEMILLDNAIVDVDKKLAVLQLQRANLAAERKRYAIVSSVFRRLPNELLLGIFSELSEQSLWRVSKVCHHWRELILQTASFWTNLVLPGPTYQNAPVAAVQELVRRQARYYVKHACGLPLSLTINEMGQPAFYAFLNDMYDPLQSLGAHWSSISVPTEDAYDINQLLRYYDYYPNEADYLSAFTLTALDLVFQDDDDFDPDDEDDLGPVAVLDLFRLTALRSLKISSVSLEIWDERLEADWGKLTSLSLACEASSQDYLEILKHCHSLEELCVLPDGDYYGPAPGPPVTLSHLRKLEITSEEQPSTFLDRLSTPILQNLILRFERPVKREPEDKSLLHFLDRFQGQLHHLACTGEIFLDEIIKERRHLHDLVSLKVTQPFEERADYEDNLFDALIYDPSKRAESQLVRLEFLKVLEHCPPLTLTATNSCAKMLESRCVMEAKLDEISSVLRRAVLTERFDGQLNGRKIFTKFCQKGILAYS